MINFSTLQGLIIPEGNVTKIEDASGNVMWSANNLMTTAVELLEQNVTEGYYLMGEAGTPTTLNGYGYTDYISVKGGTNITFSGTGGVHGLNCGFMEYDVDKNVVQRVDTSYGTYTYTLSDNTTYIRCNVKIGTSNILTYVPG